MEPIKKILRTPSAFALIVVAIIGLIGVIVQSNTSTNVVKLTIGVSLTAEAKLTQSAIQAESTNDALTLIAPFTNTPLPTSTSTSTTPIEVSARIMVDSWDTENAALVLPDNVSPEQNSDITLRQDPDFDNWLIAPVSLANDSEDDIKSGKLLKAMMILGNNSANNGSWVKIDNKISISLDLVSSNVEDHVNLVVIKREGGGGEDYKYFSPVKLDQNTDSLDQTITSPFDFFSLQPGEADVFIIDFICEAPGIYQASAKLTLTSSEGAEEEKVTGFGKIMCPNSYTLWNTRASSPLKLTNKGEYYWDGDQYIKKP